MYIVQICRQVRRYSIIMYSVGEQTSWPLFYTHVFCWCADRLAILCVFCWFSDKLAYVHSVALQTGWPVPMCIPWFTDRLVSNCVFFWFADRLARTYVHSGGLQTGWPVPVCILLVCIQVGQYLHVVCWFGQYMLVFCWCTGKVTRTCVYSVCLDSSSCMFGQYLHLFYWFADMVTRICVYSVG